MQYLAISFISGFVTMSVELIAARVVAPIIGSSIFTWTSVIGVILLGISTGNYLGGKLADKNSHKRILSWLLISASIFVALIPSLAEIAPVIAILPVNLLVKIIIISLLLFLLPAVFLGAIYPVALTLYLSQTDKIGEATGRLSALAALGSILGTFLTGFLFVGFIGSSLSLYLLSATLLISSILFNKSSNQYFLASFLIISALISKNYYSESYQPNKIFETESNYYKIQIKDSLVNEVPTRILFLDFDSHSLESLSDKKIGSYQEIAPIFKDLKSNIANALFIGGGSYHLPKDFSKIYKSNITVIEIDPAVTEVAEKFFNLSSYPVKTINADGRLYLANAKETFDLIFSDAFNSFLSMPWHLSTLETHTLAKKRLSPGGIYALNLISALGGKDNQWFNSFVKTFSMIFPNYYIIYFDKDENLIQNIILIGINSEEKFNEESITRAIHDLSTESGGKLDLQYKYQPPLSANALILKDNFAPIERLTAPMINTHINEYADWFYSIF